MRERINNQIKAAALRVIGPEGENLGILNTEEALKIAKEKELDLVEITAKTDPPVAKIIDYGKFQYQQKKKQKKAGVHLSETKSVQVKIGTGEHDLKLKADRVCKWVKEGHRVKVELFLAGRAKYLDREFLKERLGRILNLITEKYKIAEDYKKVPKGIMVTIERDK